MRWFLFLLPFFLLIPSVTAQANWWNDTWEERVNLTVQDNSGYTHSYEYVTITVTDSDISNCEATRLTDVSCGESSPTEYPREIVSSDIASNTCLVGFQANLTASTNSSYCLYYANSSSVGETVTFDVINNTVGTGTSQFNITTNSIELIIEDGGSVGSFETDSDGTNWVGGGRVWHFAVAAGVGERFGNAMSGFDCWHDEGIVTAHAGCEGSGGSAGYYQNYTLYRDGLYYLINMTLAPAGDNLFLGSENGNLHGTTTGERAIASNMSSTMTNPYFDVDKGYMGYWSSDTDWHLSYIYDETQTGFYKGHLYAAGNLNVHIGEDVGVGRIASADYPFAYYLMVGEFDAAHNDANWNSTYLNAYTWLIESPSTVHVGESETNAASPDTWSYCWSNLGPILYIPPDCLYYTLGGDYRG